MSDERKRDLEAKLLKLLYDHGRKVKLSVLPDLWKQQHGSVLNATVYGYQNLSNLCQNLGDNIKLVRERTGSSLTDFVRIAYDERVVSGQVEKIRRQLAKEKRTVTSGSVVHKVCQALGVPQFDELGLGKPHQLPVIKTIMDLEKRIETYITVHRSVRHRGISTLYELERLICQEEKVNTFDELNMGPLLEHPFVKKDFNPAVGLTSIPQVSLQDVLDAVFEASRKTARGQRVTADDIFSILKRKKEVSDERELCVYIGDVGFFMKHSGAVRQAEREHLREWESARKKLLSNQSAEQREELKRLEEENQKRLAAFKLARKAETMKMMQQIAAQVQADEMAHVEKWADRVASLEEREEERVGALEEASTSSAAPRKLAAVPSVQELQLMWVPEDLLQEDSPVLHVALQGPSPLRDAVPLAARARLTYTDWNRSPKSSGKGQPPPIQDFGKKGAHQRTHVNISFLRDACFVLSHSLYPHLQLCKWEAHLKRGMELLLWKYVGCIAPTEVDALAMVQYWMEDLCASLLMDVLIIMANSHLRKDIAADLDGAASLQDLSYEGLKDVLVTTLSSPKVAPWLPKRHMTLTHDESKQFLPGTTYLHLLACLVFDSCAALINTSPNACLGAAVCLNPTGTTSAASDTSLLDVPTDLPSLVKGVQDVLRQGVQFPKTTVYRRKHLVWTATVFQVYGVALNFSVELMALQLLSTAAMGATCLLPDMQHASVGVVTHRSHMKKHGGLPTYLQIEELAEDDLDETDATQDDDTAANVQSSRTGESQEPTGSPRHEVVVSLQELAQVIAEKTQGGSFASLAALETELLEEFEVNRFDELGHGRSLIQLLSQHADIADLVTGGFQGSGQLGQPVEEEDVVRIIRAAQVACKHCFFGTADDVKQLGAIGDSVCLHFGVQSFEQLGHGRLEHLIERMGLADEGGSNQISAGLDGEGTSCLGVAAALAISGPDSSMFQSGEGEVSLTAQELHGLAMQLITAAPDLEDLMQYCCWSTVFEPALGNLVHFIEHCKQQLRAAALQLPNGAVLKLPGGVDRQHLFRALSQMDPKAVTACLLSMAVERGCPLALPLALLGTDVLAGLQGIAACAGNSSVMETCSAQEGLSSAACLELCTFILKCLAFFPPLLRHTPLCTRVLLGPLITLLGSPSLMHSMMLEAAGRNAPWLLMLTQLGSRLGVVTWQEQALTQLSNKMQMMAAATLKADRAVHVRREDTGSEEPAPVEGHASEEQSRNLSSTIDQTQPSSEPQVASKLDPHAASGTTLVKRASESKEAEDAPLNHLSKRSKLSAGEESSGKVEAADKTQDAVGILIADSAMADIARKNDQTGEALIADSARGKGEELIDIAKGAVAAGSQAAECANKVNSTAGALAADSAMIEVGELGEGAGAVLTTDDGAGTTGQDVISSDLQAPAHPRDDDHTTIKTATGDVVGVCTTTTCPDTCTISQPDQILTNLENQTVVHKADKQANEAAMRTGDRIETVELNTERASGRVCQAGGEVGGIATGAAAGVELVVGDRTTFTQGILQEGTAGCEAQLQHILPSAEGGPSNGGAGTGAAVDGEVKAMEVEMKAGAEGGVEGAPARSEQKVEVGGEGENASAKVPSRVDGEGAAAECCIEAIADGEGADAGMKIAAVAAEAEAEAEAKTKAVAEKDVEVKAASPEPEDPCLALVNSIRRKFRGLDMHVDDMDDIHKEVLQQQNELIGIIGRSLQRLSNDLYSKDMHFVLELVQNADDNSYVTGVAPSVEFILHEDRIEVLNNETGFTPHNMRSLCDVGNSSKKRTSGYIGQKGIGFKSVFRISDRPEVHSNGFHVAFDVLQHKSLGYILPTWVGTPEYLPSSRTEFGPMSATRIVLPLTSALRGEAGDGLRRKFSDLHHTLLMFLQKLTCLAITDRVNGHHTLMKRRDLDNGIVELMHGPNGEKSNKWLVASHKIAPSLSRLDVKVDETVVSIGFSLDGKRPTQQEVFAFLPLRSYGLRFLLQGDWVVPSSREAVDSDNPWNQMLRGHVPDLFAGALSEFLKLEVPEVHQHNPYYWVDWWLSCVPLDGEAQGFFRGLPQMIAARLRLLPCIPTEDGDMVPPSQAMVCWNPTLRKLMSHPLLRGQLGLRFAHEGVQILHSSPKLRQLLGVCEYTPSQLLDLCQSLCQNQLLPQLGASWVGQLLCCIFQLLSPHQASRPQPTSIANTAGLGLYQSAGTAITPALKSQIIQALSVLPLIPMPDGSFVAAAAGAAALDRGNNTKTAARMTSHAALHAAVMFPFAAVTIGSPDSAKDSHPARQMDSTAQRRGGTAGMAKPGGMRPGGLRGSSTPKQHVLNSQVTEQLLKCHVDVSECGKSLRCFDTKLLVPEVTASNPGRERAEEQEEETTFDAMLLVRGLRELGVKDVDALDVTRHVILPFFASDECLKPESKSRVSSYTAFLLTTGLVPSPQQKFRRVAKECTEVLQHLCVVTNHGIVRVQTPPPQPQQDKAADDSTPGEGEGPHSAESAAKDDATSQTSPKIYIPPEFGNPIDLCKALPAVQWPVVSAAEYGKFKHLEPNCWGWFFRKYAAAEDFLTVRKVVSPVGLAASHIQEAVKSSGVPEGASIEDWVMDGFEALVQAIHQTKSPVGSAFHQFRTLAHIFGNLWRSYEDTLTARIITPSKNQTPNDAVAADIPPQNMRRTQSAEEDVGTFAGTDGYSFGQGQHWGYDANWTGSYTAGTQATSQMPLTLPSSFKLALQSQPWLPSSTAMGMRPAELFWPGNRELKVMFGDGVPYLDSTVKVPSVVLQELGVVQDVDLDVVLSVLRTWVRKYMQQEEGAEQLPSKSCQFTLGQMTTIYEFISRDMEATDEAFAAASQLFYELPAVWLPKKKLTKANDNQHEPWDASYSGRDNLSELLTGRFYPVSLLRFQDPTRLMESIEESDTFPIRVIAMYYKNRNFFTRQLRPPAVYHTSEGMVKDFPRARDYCDLLLATVGSNSLSRQEKLSAVVTVFSMWSSGIQRRALKPDEIRDLRTMLTPLKVFPTSRSAWVSLSDRFFIDDDASLSSRFADEADVYFLQVSQAEKARKNTRLCNYPTNIIHFLQAMQVPLLSQSVRRFNLNYGLYPATQIAEVVHKTLNYAQRCLHSICDKEEYEQIDKSSAPKLKDFKCWVVTELEVVYELITSKKELTSTKRVPIPALLDEHAHLYVQDIDNHYDICTELTRLFDISNPETAEQLADCLFSVMLQLSSGRKDAEDTMQRKGYAELPTEVEVWEVKQVEVITETIKPRKDEKEEDADEDDAPSTSKPAPRPRAAQPFKPMYDPSGGAADSTGTILVKPRQPHDPPPSAPSGPLPSGVTLQYDVVSRAQALESSLVHPAAAAAYVKNDMQQTAAGTAASHAVASNARENDLPAAQHQGSAQAHAAATLPATDGAAAATMTAANSQPQESHGLTTQDEDAHAVPVSCAVPPPLPENGPGEDISTSQHESDSKADNAKAGATSASEDQDTMTLVARQAVSAPDAGNNARVDGGTCTAPEVRLTHDALSDGGVPASNVPAQADGVHGGVAVDIDPELVPAGITLQVQRARSSLRTGAQGEVHIPDIFPRFASGHLHLGSPTGRDRPLGGPASSQLPPGAAILPGNAESLMSSVSQPMAGHRAQESATPHGIHDRGLPPHDRATTGAGERPVGLQTSGGSYARSGAPFAGSSNFSAAPGGARGWTSSMVPVQLASGRMEELVCSSTLIAKMYLPESEDLLAADDEATQQHLMDVGAWGEKLVHLYLLDHPQFRTEGNAGWKVKWMNEVSESGEPYDFLLTSPAGEKLFVEVKSTSTRGKDVFELSHHELVFAQQHGDNYHIYRVYGAGTKEPVLVRVINIMELWLHKQVKVCAVLPSQLLCEGVMRPTTRLNAAVVWDSMAKF